jgi:hypothetical protein
VQRVGNVGRGVSDVLTGVFSAVFVRAPDLTQIPPLNIPKAAICLVDCRPGGCGDDEFAISAVCGANTFPTSMGECDDQSWRKDSHTKQLPFYVHCGFA